MTAGLLLLSGLVAGAGLPAQPALAGLTGFTGPGAANEGSLAPAYCRLGTVLTGVVAPSDVSGLTGLVGRCQGYSGSGVLGGEIGNTDGYVGFSTAPEGGGAPAAACPAGMAVIALKASWTGDAHRVLGLKLVCRPTSGKASETEVVVFHPWDKENSTGTCLFATGIIGVTATSADGGYITRLRLVCDPLRLKPDKPPIKVLDGDAGQNAGNGGNAGGARAATDTTIYDQPDGNDVAYISGGDPVTIVSCNDDNWCRISKPQNGWVWGDDLDR